MTGRPVSAVLLVLAACCWCQSGLRGQDSAPESEVPLYEREEFDRITLNEANQFATLEVYPIENKTAKTIRIRRLEDPPDRLFDVEQRHIDKIESFPQMLFSQALSLVNERQVDEAFPYLERLNRQYPQTSNLDQLMEKFFVVDAGRLYSDGRYDEALLSLDEVFSRNPNREGLDVLLRRVVGAVIRDEFDRRNFEACRRTTRYARERYGNATQQIVDAWETKLTALATEQLLLASQLDQQGAAAGALAALRVSKEIWPGIPGVEALTNEILQKYPRVTVAVTQAFLGDVPREAGGPSSMNWAARRAGKLVRRRLVEFEEFTADGGRYFSPVGKLTVSADRRQVTLSINSPRAPDNVGYAISRALLDLADPAAPVFYPRWSEFLQSVYLASPNTVEIELTRATLRPEALLPDLRTEPDQPLSALLAGNYAQQSAGQPNAIRFIQTETAGQLNEIVESYFDDPTMATEALLRGEADIIDRVFPADIRRLRERSDIRLTAYRVPTVHAVVFNDRESLLRSATFRRGLLYAINRAGFVNNDLAGSGPGEIARVLSAPLPIGVGEDDPLGYAYNGRIAPRAYDPALGSMLMRLAQANMESLDGASSITGVGEENEGVAASTGETPDSSALPSLPALVLAYPLSPVPTAAAVAIAADLRRVGIEVTLRALEPGVVRPTDSAWDLLYIEAIIEEPFVDLPDLIVGQNLLGRQGGLLWQAVRTLQDASSWDVVRGQFTLVHRLAFDHTAILPLWQIVEHVAYRDHVTGIGDAPISLYQHVDQWGISR